MGQPRTGYRRRGKEILNGLDKLEDAVDRASQAIAEGRDAIGALRMSTVEKNDLAVAIKTIAEELARGPYPNVVLRACKVVGWGKLGG